MILVWSFSWPSPVDSAAKRRISPLPDTGSMVMVKKTIPRPPIQCMKLRQKSMLWGRASTSGIAVNPVAVNPDMASKRAAPKLLQWPSIRKGIVPSSENTTHVRLTTR